MGVKVREKKDGHYVILTDKKLFPHLKQGRKTKKIAPPGREGKALAERVADEIRARLVLGKAPFRQTQPQSPTLAAWWNTYLRAYGAVHLSDSTRRGYLSIYNTNIAPRWGNTPLDHIAAGDIETWLADLISGGNYRPATVQRIHSVLSSILGYAHHRRLIPSNPARDIGRYVFGDRTKGNREREIPDPYTLEELFAYLEATRSRFPDDYPFTLLLAHAGVRRSEAAGLQWGDIQWKDRYLIIRHAIVLGVHTTPKSGARRHVRMTDQLLQTLERHRTRQKRLGLTLGLGDAPEAVFTSRKGGIYHPTNWVQRVHNKATEAAGLRRIRPHDLRHTWVTLRLAAGHPIEEVSKEAGHSSIQVTADRYSHWIPSRAGTDLNAVFGAAGPDQGRKIV